MFFPAFGTEGPFRFVLMVDNIASTGLLAMLELVVENVLVTLAGNYERDPAEFCHMSNKDLASALVREAVAELRNEGYVEEQVRGVIRFTRRGYKAYRAGMSLFQYT